MQAFRASGAFTVNILAAGQNALSARFAGRDIAVKFSGVSWTAGLEGAPALNRCVASFQCEKFAEHVVGDHLLVCGKVLQFAHQGSEESLVFYRGIYMALAQSLRELAQHYRMDASDLQSARREVNGMLLLDYPQPSSDGVALVSDAAGFAALCAGGWLGGQSVYQHGVSRAGT